MKKRNIKKYYKKRIVDGWRQYLKLHVKYSDIGTENKYLSKKLLGELLQLEDANEDSGLVDHYNFYDPNYVVDGIKQFISVNLVWHYLPKDDKYTLSEYFNFPDNTIYITDEHKIYFIEGMAGFRNPKCIYDEENGYPKDEPYWLFQDNENLKSFSYSVVKDDDDNIHNKNIIEVLTRYKNNHNFSSDMFSGNIIFGLVSGNFGQNITNNLFDELSNLSSYCKTNYEDFYEDHVDLTYAIRYKENVEPFLRDLKKIILKYKIKF